MASSWWRNSGGMYLSKVSDRPWGWQGLLWTRARPSLTLPARTCGLPLIFVLGIFVPARTHGILPLQKFQALGAEELPAIVATANQEFFDVRIILAIAGIGAVTFRAV